MGNWTYLLAVLFSSYIAGIICQIQDSRQADQPNRTPTGPQQMPLQPQFQQGLPSTETGSTSESNSFQPTTSFLPPRTLPMPALPPEPAPNIQPRFVDMGVEWAPTGIIIRNGRAEEFATDPSLLPSLPPRPSLPSGTNIPSQQPPRRLSTLPRQTLDLRRAFTVPANNIPNPTGMQAEMLAMSQLELRNSQQTSVNPFGVGAGTQTTVNNPFASRITPGSDNTRFGMSRLSTSGDPFGTSNLSPNMEGNPFGVGSPNPSISGNPFGVGSPNPSISGNPFDTGNPSPMLGGSPFPTNNPSLGIGGNPFGTGSPIPGVSNNPFGMPGIAFGNSFGTDPALPGILNSRLGNRGVFDRFQSAMTGPPTN